MRTIARLLAGWSIDDAMAAVQWRTVATQGLLTVADCAPLSLRRFKRVFTSSQWHIGLEKQQLRAPEAILDTPRGSAYGPARL